MSTDLASLVVRLEANVADFTSGLNTASKKLDEFSKGAQDVLKEAAAAIGVAFSADAAVEFADSILEGAAALDKLSQQTGATVESLALLQGAAKISGIDDLSTALGKLSRSQAEVEQGNEKVTSVFKALGISISDVEGLKPDALFLKLAQAVSGFQDGATKSAAVQELLGRNMQTLIPLLDQGAAGFKALEDQVAGLGGGTSKDFAEAAEGFEQDLAKLKIAATGTGQAFIEGLLPALDSSVKGLTTFVTESRTASDGLDATSIVVKSLATALLTIVYSIETVAADINNILEGAGTEIGVYAAAIGQALKGNFKEAHQILVDGNADLQKLDETYRQNEITRDAAYSDALGKIWTDTAQAKLDAEAKANGGKGFSADDALAAALSPTKPTLVLPDVSAIKAINDEIDSLVKKAGSLDLATGMQKTNLATIETAISVGKLHDELAKAGGDAAGLTTKLLAAASAADRSEAIASIAKESAAIQAQIDTYQKSKVEVDAYTLSHGKLGEQLDALGAKGTALRQKVLDLDKQFETKVDATSLAQIDAQLLSMTGHLQAAAAATFDLQHQQLANNLAATGDTKGQATLDQLKQATLAQAAFNEEQQKSNDVNQQLEDQLANIALLESKGAITDAQAQEKETAARANAVTQLQAINAQLDDIAQKSGQTALIQGAAKAATALTNLKVSAVDPLAKAINDDLVQDASTALDDLVTGAKSAKDAIGEFLDSIAKQLLALAEKNIFQNLFEGSGSGGAGGGFGAIISGFFGGGKADGGPVNAGSAYRINERDSNSEYFIPSTNGMVASASDIGGGVTVHQQFILQAPQGTVSRQTQLQLGAQASRGLGEASRRNN